MQMNIDQVSFSKIRFRILFLQILLLILAPIWIVKVNHYFFYPLPSIYSSPSLISAEGDTQKQLKDFDIMKTFLNMSLLALFFVQHIIMASLKYKISCQKIWKEYPIYQRLIYNISSSILLYFVLQFQQPQNIVIFKLPLWFCLPLFLIGVGFLMDSNVKMEQSLMFPYNFSKLISQKSFQINKVNYDKVQTEGITIKGSYSIIRHPMQSGCLLALTFGNTVFTLEKIIIMSLMAICIYVGVLMEEKRLTKRFVQYSEYMKTVKNRFIPFLF